MQLVILPRLSNGLHRSIKAIRMIVIRLHPTGTIIATTAVDRWTTVRTTIDIVRVRRDVAIRDRIKCSHRNEAPEHRPLNILVHYRKAIWIGKYPWQKSAEDGSLVLVRSSMSFKLVLGIHACISPRISIMLRTTGISRFLSIAHWSSSLRVRFICSIRMYLVYRTIPSPISNHRTLITLGMFAYVDRYP